jgi:Protein of unknown function (DUF669)
MNSDELDTPFVPAEEKGTSYSLLPAGKYKAEIVQATYGPTKNGRGQSVKLQWVITEGEHENRPLFQDILVQHESEEAQRIGRERFKDVCEACGISDPVTKLNVLLYTPCILSVAVEKDKAGEYPDKNRIARVRPVIASENGGTPAPKGTEKPGAANPDDFPF